MRHDLEWYTRLAKLGFFHVDDLNDIYPGHAEEILRVSIDLNFIENVCNDWYVVLKEDTKYPVMEYYEFIPRMIPDSCFCLHSAFELYGLANQVYFEIYINAPVAFPYFEYRNMGFKYIPIPTPRSIVLFNNTSVTSIEQTIIDNIADLEKYCDLEETLYCMSHLPNFNEKKIIDELFVRNDSYVWQKTGFFFDYFAETYNLSNDFFEICKSHVIPSNTKLDQCGMYHMRYNPVWKFYTPESLDNILFEPLYNINI